MSSTVSHTRVLLASVTRVPPGISTAKSSAPEIVKRMVQEARDRGILIDATYGRRTQAVLIMDNDHLVLSALSPEIIAGRLEGEEPGGREEEP